MGIFKFSEWISAYFPKCITSIIPGIVQHKTVNIYIDCSYLLYFIVLDENDFSAKENMTIQQWENIAAKYVSTFLGLVDQCLIKMASSVYIEQVYLVFDGVAPAAKLVHQRRRRYTEKDNNCSYTIFTSGTILMDIFTVFLRNRIKTDPNYAKITINSCMKRGEGDIKILDLVQQQTIVNRNIYHMILSPDTDLLIITLARNIKQVTLFNTYNKFSRFIYCDTLYLDICHFLLKRDNEYIRNVPMYQIILDFCFLTFFLGNDFITRRDYIVSVKDYFHRIFKVYHNMVQHNIFLVDITTKNIKWLNYTYLLLLLNETERHALQIKYPQHNNIAAARDQWNEDFDFNLFSMRKWSWNSNDHTIACVSKRYLLTMQWTMHYWTGIPCSNFYYYPYDKSPLLYDIYTFLNISRTDSFTILNIPEHDEAHITDFITPEYNLLIFPLTHKWYFTPEQQKIMEKTDTLKHINYKTAYLELQPQIEKLSSYSDSLILPKTEIIIP